jgi:hypothetical protein
MATKNPARVFTAFDRNQQWKDCMDLTSTSFLMWPWRMAGSPNPLP